MNYLDEIDQKFPVRRSDEEKRLFREYASEKFRDLGGEARCEASRDGKHKNLVVGDPESADVVFCAHYDTPASSPFPNLMLPRSPLLFWIYQFLPLILLVGVSLLFGYLLSLAFEENVEIAFYFGFLAIYYILYFLFYRTFKNRHNRNDNTSGVASIITLYERLGEEERKRCLFVLFDNEEMGLLGSKSFYNDNKEALSSKPVINLDCVGNGKSFIFIAKPEAEKCELYGVLKESVQSSDDYSVHYFPKRGSEANSDYKRFPLGIGCMASKKTGHGIFYTPRIHTGRDVIADTENIDFIADGLSRFVRAIP